jgi:zinc resistance-associated protein
MKRLVTLALGLALLGVAATSNAGPWGGGPGMGPGRGGGGPGMGMGYGMNPYMATQLGLTPEQTSQLQSMRDEHFKVVAPLQESLFSKRQELRLMWASPTPDPGQIATKQKEITQLQGQIQEMGTAYQLEVRKVLTPEQQEKFASFMGGRGFGPGQGMGPGRGGRGW